MKKTLVASTCMLAASNAAFTAVETASLTIDKGFSIVGAANNARVGYVVASAGDFNNDNRDDLLITTPSNVAYIVFGKAQTKVAFDLFDTERATEFITLTAEAGDTNLVGGFAGDVNGDGVDDVVIGNPTSSTSAGQVYVLYGKTNPGNIDLENFATSATAGFIFSGITGTEEFGFAVAAAGDINNDDKDDILIASKTANGAVHVILGKAGADRTVDIDTTDLTVGDNGFTIEGLNAASEFGASLHGIGRVNNDNYDDILVGAPGEDIAYIIYGTNTVADIDLSVDTTHATITGVASSEFGRAVAEAGDFNNDGKDDLLIAAPLEEVAATGNTEGRVYVIFGRTAVADLADIDVASLGTAGLSITGATTTAKLGWAVAGVDDVNDDDIDDIVVTAEGSQTAYVLFGKQDIKDNIVLSGSLASDVGVIISAPANNVEFGKSVNAIGDFNGDGADDFVISSPLYDFKVDDTTTRTEAGAAWVIYGFEEPENKSSFRLGASISMIASFLIALML